MRRAAKVDSNHRVIVAAFRALGCSVQSLAAVGKGVPDLLVGLLGVNHLVEVKATEGKQTKHQVRWCAQWRTPTHMVRNIDDARRLVSAWRINATGRMLAPPPEFDADDYNGRPLLVGPPMPKPGEWLPLPHKDSPTVKR